jgi:hypothetical protein
VDAKPCLAITLINPLAPNEAASYLWCRRSEHVDGCHRCYSGIYWHVDADDELELEPTREMILWRTGTVDDIKRVNGRLMGVGYRHGQATQSPELPNQADLQRGRYDATADRYAGRTC